MYDVSLKRKWDEYSIRETALIEKERALEEGRQEGLQKGRQEGRQEGLQKGRQEGRLEERTKAEAEKRESALKMLKNGFDIQLISDIIGLPIEEIEKLK
ncbi:RpnC/YadD family protein [Sphingobacterium wenxiniae]|nr:Yae1 family protein [Sphingobacterium wenxiniae]